MAGIYVHIPFCKQACYYCDFHFSTFHPLIDPVVKGIIRELKLQKNYLKDEIIQSIYIGGGTPSLIKVNQLGSIINCISELYPVAGNPEITLEANPDDLSHSTLQSILDLGINRLSMGIQTFNEAKLNYLNRAHSGEEAIEAFHAAREEGFKNINVDLIYAINPGHHKDLKKDLKLLKSIKPDHISAYCLTIEPDTVFGRWLKRDRIKKTDDDEAASEYDMIESTLCSEGYEHYETSNYAKPGYISKHNSNYWNGESYLGVGPSAHSYNGQNRQFNIDNNTAYVKSLAKGEIPVTMDYLSATERINERIFMGLRTMWGCDLTFLKKNFNIDLIQRYGNYIDNLIKNDLAQIIRGKLILSGRGKLLADRIAEDLFIVDLEK